MRLIKEEIEKFEELGEFSGTNMELISFDGIKSIRKLVNIENPLLII